MWGGWSQPHACIACSCAAVASSCPVPYHHWAISHLVGPTRSPPGPSLGSSNSASADRPPTPTRQPPATASPRPIPRPGTPHSNGARLSGCQAHMPGYRNSPPTVCSWRARRRRGPHLPGLPTRPPTASGSVGGGGRCRDSPEWHSAARLVADDGGLIGAPPPLAAASALSLSQRLSTLARLAAARGPSGASPAAACPPSLGPSRAAAAVPAVLPGALSSASSASASSGAAAAAPRLNVHVSGRGVGRARARGRLQGRAGVQQPKTHACSELRGAGQQRVGSA